MESQAYQELVSKIDTIAEYVLGQQEINNNNSNNIDLDDMWVDSYDVCTFLKISGRTLQRMRTKRIISYTIISGKSYYTIGELKRLLNEKKIHSNDECMDNLINNYRQYIQKRENKK